MSSLGGGTGITTKTIKGNEEEFLTAIEKNTNGTLYTYMTDETWTTRYYISSEKKAYSKELWDASMSNFNDLDIEQYTYVSNSNNTEVKHLIIFIKLEE